MPIKNMDDIRQVLSDEIERLRTGKSTPANLNAITNGVGKIISTVKLEIECAKLANKTLKNGFIQLEDRSENEPPASASSQ